MGFNKAKNCKESWGMGFLLVFFPEDNHNSTAINVDNKLLSSSSSSPSPSPAANGNAFRRSNSSRILTRAQSTISICALLVFVTLLLFTLSTFEPNSRAQLPIGPGSRRFLAEARTARSPDSPRSRRALQGLGTLYRRGTKAVADLVVAHVAEDTSEDELRLFLRALHRSGVTAKSDVVLLFSSQSKFEPLIREENDSFLGLLRGYYNKTASSPVKRPGLGFDPAQFRPGKKEAGEPIWGKKGGSFPARNESEAESTRPSYGSVVGFDSSELDPENSLSGFLDHAVPMGLRRWACYPMLLGRVRRNFKHVALIDAKSAVVLGDQLGPGGARSPESVHFYSASGSKHGKRGSDKAHQAHGGVNPGVISGGARGVRRLADAMLAEIVRAATASSGQQHKRKGSAVTDSAVLSQLVGNEFLLKNVKVVRPGDSVPDASELGRVGLVSFLKHGVVQRGNGNGHEVIKSVIMKHICANEIDSSVYRDCQQKSIE